jgi:cysteine protease ATG4
MLVANSLQVSCIKPDPIKVLSLFNNNHRGESAPFSIQNVAEVGLRDFAVYPGDWYGINTASHVFQSLNRTYSPVSRFKICVFHDGNISPPEIVKCGMEGEFEDLSGEPSWCNSVLVIVSNRFGIKDVNSNYFPVIKRYMKLDSFVGLVGGKPRFAYYFVGHLEDPVGIGQKREDADRLIFLDPHFVNSHADPESAPANLFHCTDYAARSIHMRELDPCLSFGFLIESQEQCNRFVEQIQKGIKDDQEFAIFYLKDDLSASI